MSRLFLGDVARWALVAIFLASAFTKLGRRSPRADRAGELVRLGIPARVAPVLGGALPYLEILLAGALLLLPGRVTVLLAVVFLLLATGVLIRAVVRGVHEPCRCFGSFSNRPVSAFTLVRNAMILGLAAVAWWAPAAVHQDPVAGALGIAIGFALMFLG